MSSGTSGGPTRRDFLAGLGRWGVAVPVAGVSGMAVASGGSPLESGRPAEGPGAGDGIGLALGSGGASGLAHIRVFEVLDELGVKPDRIVGSSIGALLGSLYADGYSGREIRELMADLFPDDARGWLENFTSGGWRRLTGLLNVNLLEIQLLDVDDTRDFLANHLSARRFEELSIPFQAVTAELWERGERLFDEGPLHDAILASMALPGLLPPIRIDGVELLDGGMVNPVPIDHIRGAEFTIGVDVNGRSTPGDDSPGFFDSLFNTFQIMQASIAREKRHHEEPDIYLQPPIEGVRVLDFHKASSVYAQSEPEMERLKRALEEYLG
ncbi:MAG: patatin-like phospholipase family protein [Pseudomonadota bacterium]